jgi:O-methyltransferase
MTLFLATMSTVQVTSIILVLILFFLAFRILESNWSYRISKPHLWEEAVKKGLIPKKLRRIERSYRDKVRFYNFWFLIERLKKDKIQGAFAEVGVYQGVTARMIHAMDPSRTFHLFDTFEGFDKRDLAAESSNENASIDFSDTSAEAVRQWIDGNDRIIVHAGYFPETANHLEDQSFALVHIDADLYQPTIAALIYFYPKLSPGGVMIVHDYNHTWEGVGKAMAEFMPRIPEGVLEISDWQGSAVILKNRS